MFRADVHEPEYVWIIEEGAYDSFVTGVYKDAQSFIDQHPEYTWAFSDDDKENIYWTAYERIIEGRHNYPKYLLRMTKVVVQ